MKKLLLLLFKECLGSCERHWHYSGMNRSVGWQRKKETRNDEKWQKRKRGKEIPSHTIPKYYCYTPDKVKITHHTTKPKENKYNLHTDIHSSDLCVPIPTFICFTYYIPNHLFYLFIYFVSLLISISSHFSFVVVNNIILLNIMFRITIKYYLKF